MPRHTEPTANSLLGGMLAGMLQTYDVLSENTQQIVGRPGLQPDILVTAPGRAPVVIEAEFMPAYTAEEEARDRLGLEVVGTSRYIDAAIALRYPDGTADAVDLSATVADARLSYCVCYQDGTRFPASGWLEGSVEDLADLVRLVSVPQRAVDEAADALKKGIDRTASILGQLAESRPDVVTSIAGLLGMSEVLQTYRMAGAIVANAMVFHERLAGLHGVKPLSQLCSTSTANPKGNILDAWTQILKVNYWPIFSIARDIVEQIPAAEASQLLTDPARLHCRGRSRHRREPGARPDRTHLPAADSRPQVPRDVLHAPGVRGAARATRRVQDGRGLVRRRRDRQAQDRRLRVRHRRAAVGGVRADSHEATRAPVATSQHFIPVMMEEVLYGCDVMPSAIHITGSTLSGAQPNVGFGKTRLYTLAYGRQENGSVAIGSLELLQSSSTMTLFNMSDPALRTGSIGEETATQVIADIPDGGFDLVIMNPPFTSNTKHYDAGDGVLNAAFAAYDSTEADQKQMALG